MLRTNHILSLKHLAYFKNTFGSSEELTSDKVTSSAVTQSTFKSERKDYSRAIYRIVLFTFIWSFKVNNGEVVESAWAVP